MRSKIKTRLKYRTRIIKAIIYAKRIFIVIEMGNGKKHHVMELARDQHQTKSAIKRSHIEG